MGWSGVFLGVRTRVVLLSAAAVLIAAGLPSGASAIEMDGVPADLYEPDGTATTAVPMEVNAEPQHHTLHESRDVDWSRFYAVAGGTYVIEAAPLGMVPTSLYDDVGPADTQIELYSSDGVTLLQEGGYGDAVMSSRIVWKAPSSGSFYVRVASGEDMWEDSLASAPARSSGVGQYGISVLKKNPSISGTVKDAYGDPIPWTDVYLTPEGEIIEGSLGPAQIGFSQTHTDAHGRYYFFDQGAGEWNLGFDADGYIPEYWDDAVDPEDADEVVTNAGSSVTGIDAVLEEQPASIRGVLRDEDGEPVGRTLVELWYLCGCGNYHQYTSFWTEDNGSFEYWGLWDTQWKLNFAGRDQSWDLVCQPEWWQNKTDLNGADPIPVYDGFHDGSIDATVTRLPASFTGTVTSEGGEPLEDVRVQIFDAGGSWLDDTYTDSEGEYAFRSFDATITARLFFDDEWQDKHHSEWFDDESQFASATPVVGSRVNPATGLDAELELLPPQIGGTVTDQRTDDPLQGIEVWLYWQDWDTGAWRPFDYAFTDKSGDYGFWNLPCANYRIKFFDRDEGFASEWYDDVATPEEAEELCGACHESGEDGVVANAALALKLPRVAGGTRFDTALASAETAFPGWSGVEDVVIACGEDAHMVDALSASGLCWAYDAPLLLVRSGSAPGEVVRAIREMVAANGPVDLHLVGGTDAIDGRVLATLKAAAGGTADRVAGPNRYGTARAVATEVREIAEDTEREIPSAALIANGAEAGRMTDPLAFSAVSASTGIPVLLTRQDTVPDETMAALREGAPTTVVVGGSQVAVSDGAYRALGADERWAGSDRYATAVAVAKRGIAKGWLAPAVVGIAASPVDALTGGCLVGRDSGALLMASSTKLPDATRRYLIENAADITSCRLLGGPAAMNEAVRDQITIALNP